MTATKPPKLSSKQQEILTLLYNHRFLNRKQIQAFLGHKDYKTINLWLKKLREEEFVVWIYSTDFIEKTKPAVYYLGINGIRYLRQTGHYPVEELRKRYREAERSEGFRARCAIIADSCIGFAAKSRENARYTAITQAEFGLADSEYYFLQELGPHLCIVKQQDGEISHYLLEVFDATLLRYSVRKRLSGYITYLTDGSWESKRTDSPPAVLFVCPSLADLIYVKRRLRSKLGEIIEDSDLDIRVTTTDKIRTQGATAEIWESV